MKPLTFEWDPEKEVANNVKHGVTFEEALTAFWDPLGRMHSDPDHSFSERREILVGHSRRGRLLLVAFTQRRSRIRIMSARRATRRERRAYAETT